MATGLEFNQIWLFSWCFENPCVAEVHHRCFGEREDRGVGKSGLVNGYRDAT
jgi:hypothetical protein